MMSKVVLKLDHIDHLVLTVKDIEKSCAFYSQVLGMDEITFGHGRKALSLGKQKINLHQKGQEIEPKAFQPMPGSMDLCLIVNNPIEDVVAHVSICGVAIIEGPVERTGAMGKITLVYIRDPDQNLIELSVYA